jgi:uncharacterized protein (UPF0276 family)
MTTDQSIQGAGLGLRRTMASQLSEATPDGIDFLEVAPENWIGLGGRFAKQLRAISERTPLVTHGLSLSIGGPAPLDEALVYAIKDFLAEHNAALYSEHLSYSSDGGQLYDLLPMPFTEEAVIYTAERVKRVQEILGQRIALENVSYYTTPKRQLSEIEFITAVLETADCDLLLDVNNVYVNSVNHDYDPMSFIQAMPADRVSYIHIAGHYYEDDGLIVDTHGADIIDPVWQLLKKTYALIGNKPTLLERDFNIPAIETLMLELNQIREYQGTNASKDNAVA